MPDSTHRQLCSWLNSAIASKWPKARVGRITRLAGDASGRRFWRIFFEGESSDHPPSAVVVDLGERDFPSYVQELEMIRRLESEPPYVTVNRFLRSIGVAVPEIYVATARPAPPLPLTAGKAADQALRQDRLLLMEDVGSLSLFEAARRSPDQRIELFQAAIDQLILIHVRGTYNRDLACPAFALTYDERLFELELREFVDYGLPELDRSVPQVELNEELALLAKHLGSLPKVLSHRDFHAYNLFVEPPKRIRVLDYQDALMAPPVQDLAVLLTTRDTAEIIGPDLERELLDYYLRAAQAAGDRSLDGLNLCRFFEDYRMAVIQHSLKAIGRFSRLARAGRADYLRFLPYACAQARRMLSGGRQMPVLQELFSP